MRPLLVLKYRAIKFQADFSPAGVNSRQSFFRSTHWRLKKEASENQKAQQKCQSVNDYFDKTHKIFYPCTN
jgi:hypothetical protein